MKTHYYMVCDYPTNISIWCMHDNNSQQCFESGSWLIDKYVKNVFVQFQVFNFILWFIPNEIIINLAVL